MIDDGDMLLEGIVEDISHEIGYLNLMYRDDENLGTELICVN